MKKIIFLFAAVFAFTFATAQQEPSKSQKADAVGRATKLTEKMATYVTLTDAQKTKVQSINLERMKLTDLNEEKAANNPSTLAMEKQHILEKWERDLGAILTPDQMSVLKKKQAEEKAKNGK